MSELEAAQRHLNHALRRLEAALARRLSQPGAAAGESGQLARDVEMLRNECARLSAALGEAERENRELREISTHVAQRLDQSISELDRLLED